MPRLILGTEAAPRYCVTRAEWGAQTPTHITPFPAANKPTPVNFLHHTVTAFFDAGAAGRVAWDQVIEIIFSGNEPADALMRMIQDFHMRSVANGGRGWSDIAYNWLVDDSGGAYEGRGWDRTGGHTQNFNSTAFAVCIIGDFSRQRATDAALDTTAALWQEGILSGAVSPTFTLKGHRQATGALTECPGDALFAQLPDLRSRVGQPTQEDDLTPDQIIKFDRMAAILDKLLVYGYDDLSPLDVRFGAVLSAIAGITIPGGVVDVEALAEALKGALSAELAADLAARLAA